MANDNLRNPPQLEVGSVVKFNAKRKNIDYCFQGTVSSYKPETSGFMIKNVTRGTEIIQADDLFYFRLWETTDFQVIQAAEQNLGNPTNTQTDQNINVGEASSSSATLVDGQRGASRNRDSTTDTQDGDNTDRGEAANKESDVKRIFCVIQNDDPIIHI